MLHQGPSIASESLRERASSSVDLIVTKLQLYNGARAQSGPIDEVALHVTMLQANFPLEGASSRTLFRMALHSSLLTAVCYAFSQLGDSRRISRRGLNVAHMCTQHACIPDALAI